MSERDPEDVEELELDEEDEFENDNADLGDIDDDDEGEQDELAKKDDDEEEGSDKEETHEVVVEIKEKYKVKESADATVVRTVAPHERRSRNMITTGEWSALIAFRVATLQNGEPIFLDKHIELPTSPIDIATLELVHRRSPFLIIRRFKITAEIWDPNKMVHPRIEQ